MVIERTEDIEKRKRTAIFAVFVFLCLAILLFFLLKLDYRDPPLVDLHEPIEIEMQVAGGVSGSSSSAGNPTETTTNPQPSVAEPAPSVITQNSESTDHVPSSNTPSTNATATAPDPPAQPDPRFNFGGMSGGGDGTNNGGGQGDDEGNGTGQGDTGNGPGVKGFSNGRIVYKLDPFEWSTAAGYIDIRIVFYPNGKAKSVSYLKGTINDPALKQKCLEEAMKVKATSIPGAKLEFYDYRFTFTES